jgi:hypothetical protein
MLRKFFILFLFSTPIIAQDLYWPDEYLFEDLSINEVVDIVKIFQTL